ncbi:MAG: YtxH domain-containing protein [Firmicutes bacterium]|nr:YtxH domain-containing protein [Bacillota bacterium]
MLRKSFWQGLFAGGLIGAALSMMVAPQRKPGMTKRIIGKSKKMQARAQRVFKEVKAGLNDLMKN